MLGSRHSGLRLLVAASLVASPIVARGGSTEADRPFARAADLAAAFGRYDADRKCHHVTAQSDGEPFSTCVTITKTVRVETPSGPRIHVLLAGNNPKEECHACAGVIAFATFAPDRPVWRLVAKSNILIDGGWGRANPPESFEVRKLGRDLWGWIETTTYMGQGVTESRSVIYLPRDGVVVEAGNLRGDHDDEGQCADGKNIYGGGDCVDVKISLGVDASRPEAPHYPIVLTVDSKIGSRRSEKRYLVPFDRASFTYVEPGGLP